VTGDLAGYDDHRFDREELNHPTKELRERIADRVVTVVANKTSTINITLHRGGSISGSVRYDDGAPASIDIHVMANRAEGGALSPRTPRFGRSDDLGRFRVAGLPAGEYILGVTLALTHSGHDMQVLTFFYGDTLSPKAAKVIKLSEGESASGFDLTLPISGLHTITGSLFNVYGGRIDEGHVGLFNTDNFEIAQADVTTEDGIFRLGLIPDGHYTLRVTEAHDVSTQSTPPSSSGKNQTAKVATYGDFDAPLEVIGDIAGLSLTIPNKSK
jgi:hypothetical protein